MAATVPRSATNAGTSTTDRRETAAVSPRPSAARPPALRRLVRRIGGTGQRHQRDPRKLRRIKHQDQGQRDEGHHDEHRHQRDHQHPRMTDEVERILDRGPEAEAENGQHDAHLEGEFHYLGRPHASLRAR
jgi:hypothetical protein